MSESDAPCRPAWLSASASKAVPTSFRCFFGGTWTAMSGVCSTHHNYRKAAALFEMLALDFPAAELFVKLDTDAVLFPRLMRPWLRELAAAAAAAPATGGAVSLGERRLYIGTSAKMHKYTYCNDSRRVCARSSADWIALEQDIAGWNTSDAERRKRKAEVKYAWGGGALRRPRARDRRPALHRARRRRPLPRLGPRPRRELVRVGRRL